MGQTLTGRPGDADRTGLIVDPDGVAPVVPTTPEGLTGSLRANRGGGRTDKTPTAFVKLHGANTADDHETWAEGDTARTLNAMGQAGTNGALAATPGAVRRLTPTECERLQAFPDGWTVVPKSEDPEPPRFRAPTI